MNELKEIKKIKSDIQNIADENRCLKEQIYKNEAMIIKKKEEAHKILKPIASIFSDFNITLSKDINKPLKIKEQHKLLNEKLNLNSTSIFRLVYRNNPTKTLPKGYYLTTYRDILDKNGHLKDFWHRKNTYTIIKQTVYNNKLSLLDAKYDN